MTTQQEDLLSEILNEGKITCLYAIDQPLVTELCNMIKDLNTKRAAARTALESVSRLDYLQEHNLLAENVKKALIITEIPFNW